MNIFNREASFSVQVSIYIVVILPNFKRYIRPKHNVENKWMLTVNVFVGSNISSRCRLASTTGQWYQHLLWVSFHTVQIRHLHILHKCKWHIEIICIWISTLMMFHAVYPHEFGATVQNRFARDLCSPVVLMNLEWV